MLKQKAKLWDDKKGAYTDIYVDMGCTEFATQMYDDIVCASCGKSVAVAKTFSSMYIYNVKGIWSFLVCPKCHEKEMKQRVKNGEGKR